MKRLSAFFKKYLCCCWHQKREEVGAFQPAALQPFSQPIRPNRILPSHGRLKEWLDVPGNYHLVPRITQGTNRIFWVEVSTGDYPTTQLTAVTLFSDYDKQLLTARILCTFRCDHIVSPLNIKTLCHQDPEGGELLLVNYQIRERIVCSLDWIVNAYREAVGKPLPLDFIAYTLNSLIEALQYAHKNGVIFKNLTSCCIFFTDTGKLVIIPAGMLKMNDHFQMEHAYSAAALPWTPPEIILARCEISAAANVYTLGILACQLGFLSTPYQNYEPLEMLNYKCKNEFPPLPLEKKVPNSLLKFILSCTSSNPGQRATLHELQQSKFIAKYLKLNVDICATLYDLLVTKHSHHKRTAA